jgi:hypothetical protein
LIGIVNLAQMHNSTIYHKLALNSADLGLKQVI